MGQLQSKKVYIQDLQPGMYVSGLDRPWLETPFSLQGFMVRNQTEVKKLGFYCDYVYIDSSKSLANLSIDTTPASPNKRPQSIVARPFKAEIATHQPVSYREQSSVSQEIPVAQVAYQNIRAEFDSMVSRIGNGKTINITQLSEAINPLVDSISRNPGASIWLARLKSQDSYTYSHCIAVAIWCTVIGRQIGLPKKDLSLLAMGGMLLDIGKLKIPPLILNKKQQLSEREFALIKKHVDLSLKMAKDSSRVMPQAVIDMIASHHERFNGSGYPEAIKGTQIPLYSRIAAIADCYDAITSQRVYAKPITHAQAIKQMYEWRGYDFQPELIEAFIQAVGVYPTGTLVELTSGEVGIVVKENPGKRLRPQVLVILDSDKQQRADFIEMDLSAATETGNQNIEIAKTLEPGAFGLDPETLYI
ncbi:HD-GYP domain-containing protein [SAR92 clade bacterium H455]|uniref:HD-GYP domain-containing protein n=1 Tax=SAR92 clade bacterium H455 TaxID=2974818 RepID=A0ABY5TL48_9GAMM|nr:HD-GYP domain-containing protein [SAR92 clade bacterium H455]